MAEDSNANPFQDLLNAEIENIKRKEPPKKGATTGTGLVKEVVSTYPRASLTTAAVGTAGYKATTQWKSAYKEGLELIRKRGAEEVKMVKELAKSGVEAIPRIDVSNATTRQLAKQYATEKVFSGFPFKNSEAARRAGELVLPRTIITGEQVSAPLGLTYKGVPQFGESTAPAAEFRFGTKVAKTEPFQVTAETAKKLAATRTIPSTAPLPVYAGEAGQYAGGLTEGVARTLQPKGAVGFAGVERYAPQAPKPSLMKRGAELSTKGWLGKANVGLEAAGALYDIGREGGPVREAYREAGGGAGGVILGGLKATSRLGRGAANALTLGVPEYLGVYDTIDLLQVESDAKKRYMQLRGTTGYPAENFPVIKKDGKYVPMEGDNPYLSMIENRIAAERGIESSPMTVSSYKGPEYNYIVVNGKVTPMLRPEYSAMYDAQSVAAMDAANNRRPVFNVDPNFGNMGWQRLPQPAQNFGDYVDYMKQR